MGTYIPHMQGNGGVATNTANPIGHDEWCPMNGCRCKKCPCAMMPECPRPTAKPRQPHPDTQIGRLPCTCNQAGRAAVWHIAPCEIKLVHLESLR